MAVSAAQPAPGLAGATSPPQRRANPAPLAFGAFAGTTFLLSWVNAGQIDPSALGAAVATAWVFGGVIQILVAFWHFRNDELFPAVTFGSFGAFWVSFGFFGTLYLDHVPAAVRGPATALFLVPWAVFSLYMLIGSLRTNRAIFIAFILVEATLIPLIYGQDAGSATAIKIGGWFGIALAIEVWYIAAAEVLNHQFERTVLPLGQFGAKSLREFTEEPRTAGGRPNR
jgi:succinate-acetate transporter protein